MLNPRGVLRERSVAVAVDEDKSSQNALKWATDHLLSRGQTVTLVHVNHVPSPPECQKEEVPGRGSEAADGEEPENQQNDLFLPFRVFCSRREILWNTITLQAHEIAKALIEFALQNRIETLVLGSPSKRSNFSRLFTKNDIASSVSRGAPNFCTVYVISKGKVASSRTATRPFRSILPAEASPYTPQNLNGGNNFMSLSLRANTSEDRVQDEYSLPNADISFVSLDRVSTDSMFLAFYEDLGQRARRSTSTRGYNLDVTDDKMSSSEEDSKRKSFSPRHIEAMEEKTRMLELQMKQTMDMYHAACREALFEKQKRKELQQLRREDENKLRDAERAKEKAVANAEKAKAEYKKAIEGAEAATRKAEKDMQTNLSIGREARGEAEWRAPADSTTHSDVVSDHQSLLHIIAGLYVLYLYFSMLV